MASPNLNAICKRISEAADYLIRNDAEAALTPLLNIVDALAGNGRSAYKAWIASHMDVISLCFFNLGGHSFANVNLPHIGSNPQMKKPGLHGTVPFEEIIYHLIRNGLVHDCSIYSGIRDIQEASYQYDPSNGIMYLNFNNLAMGLLMAILMDIPEQKSSCISGHVTGYHLSNLCGLNSSEMKTMLRSFYKELK